MTRADLPPTPPLPQPQPQTWYRSPPPRRTALLPPAAAALVGGAAGYLAHALAANARAYCDAGWEQGGRFELTFEMLFLVPGCALLALLLALSTRRLPLLLRAVPVLAVLAGVVLWYFAVKGTLAGYPGDSGRCGPDNVPPWWPGWLPA
ncbi:hypothetical protein ACFQ7B_24615 [Streptomyces erythrochromogenes]|uniref:hypothetical protein n=1 Tax=Streptomyces erythrochromogenes TaxID=285574 RepID=UPI0036B2113F